MKNLWIFGIIILLIIGIGVFNIQYSNASTGWPGHHGGRRCFIEAAASNDSVENEDSTPAQNTDEDLLAYRGGGGYRHGGGYGHGGGHRGHGGHHHNGCFINTVSDNSWFENIFDFIWRPRS
jgi:hypothetical protein